MLRQPFEKQYSSVMILEQEAHLKKKEKKNAEFSMLRRGSH